MIREKFEAMTRDQLGNWRDSSSPTVKVLIWWGGYKVDKLGRVVIDPSIHRGVNMKGLPKTEKRFTRFLVCLSIFRR